jgi:hypothetical protein
MPATKKGWIVLCGGLPDCGFRMLITARAPLRIHAAVSLHQHLCPDMHPTDVRALATEAPASPEHELK